MQYGVVSREMTAMRAIHDTVLISVIIVSNIKHLYVYVYKNAQLRHCVVHCKCMDGCNLYICTSLYGINVC